MPAQLYESNNGLVSDSIQEVISYRPHWIVRRGNTFFFFIILMLISLTWFINYPDTIDARARIIALNPPKLINSRVEGKLAQLFVSNEQMVSKDQHLAYIENTANYEEIMKLKYWIDTIIPAIQNGNYDIVKQLSLHPFTRLGLIQPDYQLFQNQLTETKQTLDGGYYIQKRNALQQDLQYLSKMKSNTTSQMKLQEKDKELQHTEYKAYEQLEKEKVIAPLELNLYKSKLIVKENNLNQLNNQLTSNEISSHNKRKELADLQKTTLDQRQLFYSALIDLKSKIESWMQQYVLVASEAGLVVFTASFQPNQLIANGQDMFYIQPEQAKFYAEIMASQKGLGKIATNQKVILKVESYPSSEFGYLTGRVQHISSIPGRTDSFLIKAELPAGLITNYKRNLYFRNNLLAKAEIVTADRQLIDRFFGNLKKNVQ